MPARKTFRLFSLGATLEGEPKLLTPASFYDIAAKEVQDLERWLKQEPEVMGEDLKIVASQFASFDKTRDRPDLLALDRSGKLVVIEIKRGESRTGQDLQALRYAAYVATFQADQVIELYQAYELEERKRSITSSEARDELESFVVTGDLDALDEDEEPRLMLVAGGFPIGVTNTALWLTRRFGLDITCVQLVPVRGEW